MSEQKEISSCVVQKSIKGRKSNTVIMSCSKHHSPSTPILRVKRTRTPSCSESFEGEALCSKKMIEECLVKDQLFKIYGDLKRNNLELEKRLNKIKIVKQHHSKIKPKDIVLLTEKWVTTAQVALVKLYEEFPEPKPNDILCLINNLRIDPAVVKYDPDHNLFVSI